MQTAGQSAVHTHSSNPYYELGIVLPSQYYDIIALGDKLEGERRLMLAVLQDGIQCYLRNARPKTLHQQAMLREAKAWLNTRADGVAGSPFGFEEICLAFEIEPTGLRRRLVELASTDGPTCGLRRLPQAAGPVTQIRAGTSRFRRRRARG